MSLVLNIFSPLIHTSPLLGDMCLPFYFPFPSASLFLLQWMVLCIVEFIWCLLLFLLSHLHLYFLLLLILILFDFLSRGYKIPQQEVVAIVNPKLVCAYWSTLLKINSVMVRLNCFQYTIHLIFIGHVVFLFDTVLSVIIYFQRSIHIFVNSLWVFSVSPCIPLFPKG